MRIPKALPIITATFPTAVAAAILLTAVAAVTLLTSAATGLPHEEAVDDAAGTSTAVEIDLFGKPKSKNSGLHIGDGAPDFLLRDLTRRKVELLTHRGQVVLLDFWATWCNPCLQSLPHIQRIHTDYADSGLQVLSVNVDVGLHKVQPFMQENRFSFPVLFADRDMGSSYEIYSIPTSYLIDRDGIVQYRNVGYSSGDEAELEKRVVALLATQASSNRPPPAADSDKK